MNKKGFGGLEILIIILVLLFIFSWVLIGFSIASHKRCSNECADRGTRFSDVTPNGELFNTRDLCSCYFEDGTEAFVMGDKDE